MEKKPEPIATCPSCSSRLKVSRMICPDCGLVLEGDFTTSRLGLLPPAQQKFVEIFLAARGNIREVERVLGISYPTVRKRLDEVLAALGTSALDASEVQRQREAVLTRIEAGELSAREGARLLREM
jgi:hypothetical protein